MNWIYVVKYIGFLGGSMVWNLPANSRDEGSNPELGRSPGEGNGNLLQYFYLGNAHGQRSLVGYNPWGSLKNQTQLSD